MGILKTLIISHKRATNGNYVILLQRSPAKDQPSLIFEAGTVISLDPYELDTMNQDKAFTKFLEGFACLGMLRYSFGASSRSEVMFLIIVTGCVSVGKMDKTEIFRITDVCLLSMRNETGDQDTIQSLKRLLSSGCFYFSHCTTQNEFDITLSAQRARSTNKSDARFFWNRSLHKYFCQYSIDTSKWLIKVICGAVNISTVYIGGLQARACLISRLSCERAGTRFNVRGTNDLGHVANFVETEQVIFIGNTTILSYLIVRGSVPLFWEQPGVQVGSHRIRMSRGSEISQLAYDKHLVHLYQRYNSVKFLNLLSSSPQREGEVALNKLFSLHHKASSENNGESLINYDYHACCTRANQNKPVLEKLYQNELAQYTERFSFFHSTGSSSNEPVSVQLGVIRVNCLDCLDRTNAMQTFIGLQMLKSMFQSDSQPGSPNNLNSLRIKEADKIIARLSDIYENLWAYNGDQLSMIYTGTGALDGKNLLKDGTLSVARTIQNNLLDGNKQEAMDMIMSGPMRDTFHRGASAFLPHYYMHTRRDIVENISKRYLAFCKQEQLRVAVATWNVNGGRYFDSSAKSRPISDWLVNYRDNVETNLISFESSPLIDIYAIGFQEIVDLNAQNIVVSSQRNRRDWLVEIQNALSVKGESYVVVSSVQLVGICLFVFIRKSIAHLVKDVSLDTAKTGLGGTTGNKGAVAIRFQYKASTFCFVCGHFAAGQSHFKERNNDYNEICKNLQFSPSRPIDSHDYVFWCGDFNYRLNGLSNEEARRLALKRQYDILVSNDQLKQAQKSKLAFKGYFEGNIDFAPTYKYDPDSQNYDTSEKCRMPAYTDRVLLRKNRATHRGESINFEHDLNQMIKFYNRIELLSSDHRPVVAEFEIEIIEVDTRARYKLLREDVFDEIGPPDQAVIIHYSPTTSMESILKLLSETIQPVGGEILIARRLIMMRENCLLVIFSHGKAALETLRLNYTDAGTNIGILKVELRMENWRQCLLDELIDNMDSTVNLVNGKKFSHNHLNDEEEEEEGGAKYTRWDASMGGDSNPDTSIDEISYLEPEIS